MNTTSERRAKRPPLAAWDGAMLSGAFAAARRTQPWTLGYQSFDDDQVVCDATIYGRIPDGLEGALFRNGPGGHERFGQRYGHRWDGDGLLQRFSVGPNGVHHSARYVRTAKRQDEGEAGRLIYSAFGTAVDRTTPTEATIERSNPANISVIPFNNELLALWEAGAPYRVDPLTLETLGPKRWQSAESLVRPFSAHPHLAPDGSLWNFGIEPLSDRLTLYQFRGGRDEPSVRTIHVENISPVHDFAVTDQHVVLLQPSIEVNKDALLAGECFGQACRWSPQLGMRVVVITSSTGATSEYLLPAGCLFHVANAWEEGSAIHVNYMRAADPTSLMAGWTIMAGQYRHRRGAALTRMSIDTARGTAEQRTLVDHDAEFPAIDAARSGQPYGQVLCVERSGSRAAEVPGFDQVTLIDTDTGRARCYHYGGDWMVEEHLVVQDASTKAPRWAMGTALNLRSQRTVLSIFELNELEDGPVAQAELAYPMPLGLHGSFVHAVAQR